MQRYATSSKGQSAARDGTHGWAVRAVHSNSASVVFVAMYSHAVRAWAYAVVPTCHGLVWIAGTEGHAGVAAVSSALAAEHVGLW